MDPFQTPVRIYMSCCYCFPRKSTWRWWLWARAIAVFFSRRHAQNAFPKAFVFPSYCLFTFSVSLYLCGEKDGNATREEIARNRWHLAVSSLAISSPQEFCPARFNPNQWMHNISPPPLSDSTLFFAFALDGLSASEASCFVSEIQSRASFLNEFNCPLTPFCLRRTSAISEEFLSALC